MTEMAQRMREVMARFPESFFVVIARDTAAEYLAEVERRHRYLG